MSDSISKVLENKKDARYYFQNRKKYSFEEQLRLYKEFGKYLSQLEDAEWDWELTLLIKGETE